MPLLVCLYFLVALAAVWKSPHHPVPQSNHDIKHELAQVSCPFAHCYTACNVFLVNTLVFEPAFRTSSCAQQYVVKSQSCMVLGTDACPRLPESYAAEGEVANELGFSAANHVPTGGGKPCQNARLPMDRQMMN